MFSNELWSDNYKEYIITHANFNERKEVSTKKNIESYDNRSKGVSKIFNKITKNKNLSNWFGTKYSLHNVKSVLE